MELAKLALSLGLRLPSSFLFDWYQILFPEGKKLAGPEDDH